MIDASVLLGSIPEGLRSPLIASYRGITANFSQSRWEPAELNGGKFCEVVFCILEGCLTNSYPLSPTKPPNFLDACRALEKHPADSSRAGDRSLRILIPRILISLYEIRNNRGVGHIGGDVGPNYLDATAVLGMSSWTLAELIRIFHNTSTELAQQSVDALVERKLPLVWKVGNAKRILSTELTAKQKVLVLLYSEPGWVSEDNLVSWVEYGSKTSFKSRILSELHNSRLIEHDSLKQRAQISPLGSKEVEDNILAARSIS